jgi:O-antigen/teichoic acid export membrane protein
LRIEGGLPVGEHRAGQAAGIDRLSHQRESPGIASGQRLARNTLWSLLGQGAPLLAALVTIPVLVRNLGTERFGILTLIWMVIGYFSVFDLGLGRALTKLVAGKLGAGKMPEIPALVWTGLYLVSGLGALGTIVLLAAAPPLVKHVLKIPEALRDESITAFWILAFSIPFVVCSVALCGVLEANQRFKWVNAIRLPLGLATFAGPLLILPFSDSLVPITGLLFGFRAAALCAYGWMCLRMMPALRRRTPVARSEAVLLLGFGGWMTVSNLVGPMMMYMDRLVIGSLVSIAAVAYYVTPYELVTKVLILPAAIASVLFPAFSANLEDPDGGDSNRMFWRAVKYTLLLLFPVLFATTLFSRQFLALWLGHSFSQQGALVLQLLSAGVFANGLAFVPYALIQSAGRPDITAKLHCLELPLYALMLVALLDRFGIAGAALAWALRTSVDAGALFSLAARIVPSVRGTLVRELLVFAAAMTAFVLAAICPAGWPQAVLFGAVIAPFGWFGWRNGLSEGERRLFLEIFRKRLSLPS